jgi:D-galactarolactone cycloisomerase
LFWGKAGLALTVIGAMENALWDIKGKAAGGGGGGGVPVYELLGGKAHERIKVYASGGLEDDEAAIAREMHGYREKGIKAVKIRIWRDLARDTAKMRLARRELGDDIDLMVDAVMGVADGADARGAFVRGAVYVGHRQF